MLGSPMIYLAVIVVPAGPACAARLTLDDRASLWPRASMNEKIASTDRMGRSFKSLSSGLDNHYFMRCLEETANIGDTKALRLEEMVRACVSVLKDE